MTVKVLFIGDREVGTQALLRLMEMRRCTVTGVVTSYVPDDKKWWPGLSPKDIAESNSLPCFNAGDSDCEKQFMSQTERPDLVLAVLNNRFRSKDFLEWPQWYVVNLHGAPLPEFQGNNCTLHAILEGAGEFGTTLYRTTEEIDVGEIVAQRKFPINPKWSNRELYKETVKCGVALIEQELPRLLSGNLGECSVFDKNRARFFDAIPSRDIDPEKMSGDEIDRRVRAFYFPPFEPASLLVKGKRFWLFPEECSDEMTYRRGD